MAKDAVGLSWRSLSGKGFSLVNLILLAQGAAGGFKIVVFVMCNLSNEKRSWRLLALSLATLLVVPAGAMVAPKLMVFGGQDVDGLDVQTAQVTADVVLKEVTMALAEKPLYVGVQGRLAGLWRDGSETLVVAVGPQLVWHYSDTFEVRVSSLPAYVQDPDLSGYRLGGNFHFLSSFEIDWHLGGDWHLNWQVQHISNAGTSKPNPGINLMMLGIGKRI